MLKLFYVPGSCARASHIALREAGAEFELRLVDFAAAEQRTQAYHSVNPKGRVPVLQTPADTAHNLYYRHRCPVHGTAYASLFLHPSASVITQLGQSCSAATRLSLHIPPAHVAVDTAQ